MCRKGVSTSEDSWIAVLKVLSLFRSALIGTLGVFGLGNKKNESCASWFSSQCTYFRCSYLTARNEKDLKRVEIHTKTTDLYMILHRNKVASFSTVFRIVNSKMKNS